jgi:uncharacterized membrane protein
MNSDQNLPAKPEQIDIPPPNNDVVRGRGMQVHAQSFSGPLPPPELLAKYESACPGCADRILSMAEEEGKHRRQVEQRVIDAQVDSDRRESNEARRGQICALVITLAAIGAGAYTALQGHEVAGSIIGVGGIGSIVTTFILGSRSAAEPGQDPPSTKPASSKPKPKNRK